MLIQLYLSLLVACGSSEEKDTGAVEDTAEETQEDTAEVENEEVRPLPETGCEQEGWLLLNGGEYYYFMNAYNEDELVVYHEINNMSLGLDNSIDESYWYTYNSEGLLENQKDDLNGDGEADQMAQWVYESNGYPIEYRMDNEMDGIYDDELRTTRDDEGYVLEQTFDDVKKPKHEASQRPATTRQPAAN